MEINRDSELNNVWRVTLEHPVLNGGYFHQSHPLKVKWAVNKRRQKDWKSQRWWWLQGSSVFQTQQDWLTSNSQRLWQHTPPAILATSKKKKSYYRVRATATHLVILASWTYHYHMLLSPSLGWGQAFPTSKTSLARTYGTSSGFAHRHRADIYHSRHTQECTAMQVATERALHSRQGRRHH